MDRQSAVDQIAARAQEIYQDRFQKEYEAQHAGEFVAIDITTGEAYLGEFSEVALQKGREDSPYGVFHLIRIGSPGAFRVGDVNSESATRYW